MPFLILFLTLGLPLGIVVFVFALIGRKKNGVWLWTQIYMLIYGKKSTAVIVDLMEKVTSITINKSPQYMFTIVMDVVDPSTGSKYRVKGKYMDSWYSILKNKNAEIPVIIHPKNDETVMIDYKTIRRNQKEATKQRNQSDENRLNSLMKN
jgi:hypothetical protein